MAQKMSNNSNYTEQSFGDGNSTMKARSAAKVQFDVGRDLRPGQLGNMLQTLSNWYRL
ncbi:hypothetical protein NC653_019645 [Populus alba x Populus x berolinensis]|uniref:Uncharacterized protein n=1 Tax=Populus alba x Populus x berolinensis TaxID=444605 RepID=A0AAD6QJN6_9ROSI|nr:hypothetical protein NC653_019645 [Populus alba x Populus x berolinensis]